MADQLEVRGPESRALAVESNGLNVIADEERKGRPSQLFWPWFGANVSVLGLSYGAFALGFGISFWQALVAGVVGIVFSFLLCGLVSLAGKRGSAPTMALSRAAFGVRGNKLPSLVSWVLTVGWETVLTIVHELAHYKEAPDEFRSITNVAPRGGQISLLRAMTNADTWAHFAADLNDMLPVADKFRGAWGQ